MYPFLDQLSYKNMNDMTEAQITTQYSRFQLLLLYTLSEKGISF